MKLIIKITALIISFAGFAAAATIAGSNYIDGSSNPILAASGALAPANAGYVALGYFTVTDATLQGYTASSDIAAAFVIGGSDVFGFGVGQAGFYSVSGGPSSTAFNGKTLYTLMASGSSIATSTEFLIIKSTLTILADPSVTDTALVSSSTGNIGSILVGSQTTAINGLGEVSTPVTAYRMTGGFTAVPEPSAALLGALGALGLLRRRRN